jgi:hypothetical protein
VGTKASTGTFDRKLHTIAVAARAEEQMNLMVTPKRKLLVTEREREV